MRVLVKVLVKVFWSGYIELSPYLLLDSGVPRQLIAGIRENRIISGIKSLFLYFQSNHSFIYGHHYRGDNDDLTTSPIRRASLRDMGTTGKLTVCPACKDIITLTHTIFDDLVCEACYHDIVEDLGTDIVPAKHPLVTIIADGIMKGRSVVVKEVGHNQANLMIGDELIDRITCTAPVDTVDNAAAAYCDELIREAKYLIGEPDIMDDDLFSLDYHLDDWEPHKCDNCGAPHHNEINLCTSCVLADDSYIDPF